MLMEILEEDSIFPDLNEDRINVLRDREYFNSQMECSSDGLKSSRLYSGRGFLQNSYSIKQSLDKQETSPISNACISQTRPFNVDLQSARNVCDTEVQSQNRRHVDKKKSHVWSEFTLDQINVTEDELISELPSQLSGNKPRTSWYDLPLQRKPRQNKNIDPVTTQRDDLFAKLKELSSLLKNNKEESFKKRALFELKTMINDLQTEKPATVLPDKPEFQCILDSKRMEQFLNSTIFYSEEKQNKSIVTKEKQLSVYQEQIVDLNERLKFQQNVNDMEMALTQNFMVQFMRAARREEFLGNSPGESLITDSLQVSHQRTNEIQEEISFQGQKAFVPTNKRRASLETLPDGMTSRFDEERQLTANVGSQSKHLSSHEMATCESRENPWGKGNSPDIICSEFVAKRERKIDPKLEGHEMDKLRTWNEEILWKIVRMQEENVKSIEVIERLIETNKQLLNERGDLRAEVAKLNATILALKEQVLSLDSLRNEEQESLNKEKDEIKTERDRFNLKWQEFQEKQRSFKEEKKKFGDEKLRILMGHNMYEDLKETFTTEWLALHTQRDEIRRKDRELEWTNDKLQRRVDRLMKENEALISENKSLKEENDQLVNKGAESEKLKGKLSRLSSITRTKLKGLLQEPNKENIPQN